MTWLRSWLRGVRLWWLARGMGVRRVGAVEPVCSIALGGRVVRGVGSVEGVRYRVVDFPAMTTDDAAASEVTYTTYAGLKRPRVGLK